MKFIVLFVLLFSFPMTAHAFTPDYTVENADDVFHGALLKSEDNDAVYYINEEEGTRHAFPNERIYKSWYENFDSVQEVLAEDLSAYQLGSNVLYRPGSRLIKIPSVAEVYAVEPNGVLKNIPDESIAVALYGENWADLVDDVDISFFFDYTIGGTLSVIDSQPVYPIGTIVADDDGAYIVDQRSDGKLLKRPIDEEWTRANRFGNRLGYALTPENDVYELGIPVLWYEASWACVSCTDELYKRISIQQTQSEAQRGFQFDLPQEWRSTFYEPESVLSDLFDLSHVGEESTLITMRRTFALENDFQRQNWMNEHAEYRRSRLFAGDVYQHMIAGRGMIDYSIYFHQDDYLYELNIIDFDDKMSRNIDVIDLLLKSLTFPQ